MLPVTAGKSTLWILLRYKRLCSIPGRGMCGTLMCRGEQLQSSDLGLAGQRLASQNLEELSLEAVESILIHKALQRFQGNVSQAAEALGLSRGALYRRMEKYGL